MGAGDSGLQISAELARDHNVYLSRRTRRPYIPQRLVGKGIFWVTRAPGLYFLGLPWQHTPAPPSSAGSGTTRSSSREICMFRNLGSLPRR